MVEVSQLADLRGLDQRPDTSFTTPKGKWGKWGRICVSRKTHALCNIEGALFFTLLQNIPFVPYLLLLLGKNGDDYT
jgi:hypothetical protein